LLIDCIYTKTLQNDFKLFVKFRFIRLNGVVVEEEGVGFKTEGRREQCKGKIITLPLLVVILMDHYFIDPVLEQLCTQKE
jgi:hypothetical protein